MRILIAETKDFSRETVILLNKTFEVDVRDIESEEVPLVLDQYDVFWFRLKYKLTSDIILNSNKCKYIICPVTGLDHIDIEACKIKGINIISLKGETAFLREVRATAEHTIGLTLSLLRQIPAAVRSVQNGIWNRDLFKGNEIYGKKVGILGVGRLGKITASYFKCFGAEVYGYDISPVDASTCTPVSSMDELFASTDIISIHVNLNDATHHLVTKKQLALMKPGSFLINTSRGSIIKSEDLIWALEEQKLAGAAIDVIENEFNHKTDLLTQYAAANKNLIITPHIGGNTWESFAKTELFVANKLLKLTDNN